MNKNIILMPKTKNNIFLKRQRNRSKTYFKTENLTPSSSTTLDTNDDKFDFYNGNEGLHNLKEINVQNIQIDELFSSTKTKVYIFVN